MVNRINLLLQAKNISAKQFAEEIGVQPSGMSHILSGRNNPSLEFVMKVVRRWPEINLKWLILGTGEMYEGFDSSTPLPSPTIPPQPPVERVVPETYDLFSQPEMPPDPMAKPTPIVQQQPVEPLAKTAVDPNGILDQTACNGQNTEQSVKNDNDSFETAASKPIEIAEKTHARESPLLQSTLVEKKITKIVVLYDDHTFSEYRPDAKLY